MFVDLHTHILPGMDDGAKDLSFSLEMLKMAEENVTGHIFVTPHYIHNELDNNTSIVREKYNELVSLAVEKGINVKLYPGSEVFIHHEIPELLEAGAICTLNNSSYVLIEFPMESIPVYTDEILYRMELKGYIPIIAHPERNKDIANNPNLLYDLVERGVLAQVNSTSLTGLYGSKVFQTALTLIKHRMVHFVASDAHTMSGRAPRLKKAFEIVAEREGKDTALKLFVENGMAVINNESIEVPEPIMVKTDKSFFMSAIKDIITHIFS